MHDLLIKTFPSGRRVFQFSQNPVGVSADHKKPLRKEKKIIPLYDDGELVDMKAIESKQRSLRRTKQAVYDLAFANDWEYFLTVTFSNEKVDRYNYDEVVKKYSKQLDNLKQRHFPNMEYMMVPERHEDGAYHFHGLIKGIPENAFQNAINPHTGKKIRKANRYIYNCDKFDLGYNTFSRIDDSEKASTYLSKYITKTLVDELKGKKKYWSSRGLTKPIVEKILLDPESKDNLLQSILDSDEVVSCVTKTVDTLEYTNTFTYIVTQPGCDPQYIYRVLLSRQAR